MAWPRIPPVRHRRHAAQGAHRGEVGKTFRRRHAQRDPLRRSRDRADGHRAPVRGTGPAHRGSRAARGQGARAGHEQMGPDGRKARRGGQAAHRGRPLAAAGEGRADRRRLRPSRRRARPADAGGRRYLCGVELPRLDQSAEPLVRGRGVVASAARGERPPPQAQLHHAGEGAPAELRPVLLARRRDPGKLSRSEAPRPAAAQRDRQSRREEFHQGHQQGSAEDLLEDGHQHAAELSRRAGVRSGGPEPVAGRRLLPGDDFAGGRRGAGCAGARGADEACLSRSSR